MHHICAPKRMLTGLLTVALTAIFAQSALAYSVGQNDNTIVAHATVSGESTTKAPLVIPYLSHGVGVDQSLYSGQASGAFERAVNRHEAFVNRMNATAAPAVRPDNRGGTLGIGSASQSQPTAVRPDDRAGTIGIGATQTAQSAGSSSSTDWSSILVFGGVALGAMLLIAAGVAMARPRKRVLAH
jgi:hypothetical protein